MLCFLHVSGITILNASRMVLVIGKYETNPFEFHEKRFGDVDICFVDLLDSNKRGLQSKQVIVSMNESKLKPACTHTFSLAKTIILCGIFS